MLNTETPRRNLGVWDTEFLKHDQEVQVRERTRHETNTWIKQESQDERFVDEVTDVERQLGRTMDRGTFKSLLEGLNERLRVDFHPRLPTLQISEVAWAAPWERDPFTGRYGGLQKRYKMAVGSLEVPILPEWSLLESKTSLSAGGEKIKIPSRVLAHGWRRALVQLVHAGYLTRTQVEKVIEKHGSGTRPSWQILLGYQEADGREFVY